jgi:hypothetical protein
VVPPTLGEHTEAIVRRARVRLTDGKLYSADVKVTRPWVHLTDVERLTHHLDGFASRPVEDLSVPSRSVAWIRWQA